MIIGAGDAGLSERQYAAHVGPLAGRDAEGEGGRAAGALPDGSIDAAASDARRAATTDPSKTRQDARAEAEAGARSGDVGRRRDAARTGPGRAGKGGGTTFLQARTANEVLKAQERRIRLQKLKGELIDRARAMALVFRLARRGAGLWVNWPARVAALMAADLGVEPAAMQKALETHVRAHLDELAEVRPDFR